MFKIQKIEYTNKTFRLPTELVKNMETIAQNKGVSLNNLVIQCCEYALANLRMWSDSFQTRAGIFRGQLYFHMSNIDELLFPCGDGLPTAEDLHSVSEGMKAAGY